MYNSEEFRKFATKEKGISSLKLDQFQSAYANYISPTIIEERQMNIASMDVFSRLMMDRIIFLGVPINDYVANIIQAQLLFLESVDSKKDIQIYLNSPEGSVYAGLGIYDTMQYINLMLLQFVLEWLHQWGLFYYVLEQKVKELHYNTQEL